MKVKGYLKLKSKKAEDEQSLDIAKKKNNGRNGGRKKFKMMQSILWKRIILKQNLIAHLIYMKMEYLESKCSVNNIQIQY
jgi:hypothetical protein